MDKVETKHGLEFYRQFAIKLIMSWIKKTGNNFPVSEEAICGVTNVLVKSELSFKLEEVPADRRVLKTPDELVKDYMLSNGIKYIKQFFVREKKRKLSKKRLICAVDLENNLNKKRNKYQSGCNDYTLYDKTQQLSVLDRLIHEEDKQNNSRLHEVDIIVESAGLTNLEKQTIRRRYWEDMTLKEIADLDHVSPQNVFITCERAKQKIEKAILRCK